MLPIFRLLFKESPPPVVKEPVEYKKVEPPGKGCPFALFAAPFIIGDQVNKAIGVDKYIDMAMDATGVPALINGIQNHLTSSQAGVQKQKLIAAFTPAQPEPAAKEFYGTTRISTYARC
jgi:hypothetical protein